MTDLTEEPKKEPKRAAKSKRSGSWLKKIKRGAWRITAGWYWLELIAHFTSGQTQLNRLQAYALVKVLAGLSSVGFSPASPAIFPIVAKWVWLLLICGFSFLQLFSFFAFYLPAFPITVVTRIFFHKNLGDTSKAQDRGLSLAKSSRTPLGSASAIFLTAWLILYVNSTNFYAMCIGVILCGGLFLSRLLVAFKFTRPSEEIKKTWIDTLTISSLQQMSEEAKKVASKEFKKKMDVTAVLFLQRLYYRILRRIVLATRGSTGRARISMLVMSQYVNNLLILGALNVLFWALIFKASSSSHASIQDAILSSAAHVIPGVTAHVDLPIRTGLEVVASLSGWFLFVIYAGPAASIFPNTQQAYVNAAAQYHKRLRPITAVLRAHLKLLETVRRDLPS